jgi:uncharacterized metal-binding protein
VSDQCCSGDNVLIFACSGGSNVGQITNEAAKKLDDEGVGTFYCLAGVAGKIEPIIANTRGADRVICLDGCSVACAKAVLEMADVPISCYVVATDLGIEKGHHFDLTDAEVESVCAAARRSGEGQG